MKKLLIILVCLLLATPASAMGFLGGVKDRIENSDFSTPEPAPTKSPATSEYFDYDAIIADPDTYKGFHYSLVCDVARIDEVDMDVLDWTRPVMALMSVDGDIGKVVYVAFDNPAETIQNGDTVYMFTELISVTDMKTALGFYAKVPMLVAYTVEPMA